MSIIAKNTREGTAPLPCLNSNISNESVRPLHKILSTQHRKTAFALSLSVSELCSRFGIDRIGFLTLTFPDHVICPREAQRRFNSLSTRVLKSRYCEHIGVMERQKSGRIHFHLLLVLSGDIRSGVNFEEMKNKNYTSAGHYLRSEWAFWRETSPKYSFGRTELMPVYSTTEAISNYVGKYIGKHIEVREDRDKGARLVRYSQGARFATTRMQFVSSGSANWRFKVSLFASMVGDRRGLGRPATFSEIRSYLGPRWAFNHRSVIASFPDLPSASSF